MDFKDQVKQVREQLKLSQEAFARKLNVSFATVNRWETGKCLPTFDALKSFQNFCKENNLEVR